MKHCVVYWDSEDIVLRSNLTRLIHCSSSPERCDALMVFLLDTATNTDMKIPATPRTRSVLVWNNLKTKFFLKKKIFGGHMSFYGATDTPILDFSWCLLLVWKPRVCSLIHTWQRHMWCMFHDIYLWCDTCWALDGQHGGQSLFPTCVFKT